MNYPNDRKYTKDHEWVAVEGDTATIGVTQYAQEQLGDIVYVELPQVGQEFSKGDTFGVLESVKAVSDCFVPISGKITEVNDVLTESPEIVNEDAHGEGWMIRMEMTNPSEFDALMNQAQYEAFVKEETE